MSIVVEDGTGLPNAEAYISTADAGAYVEDAALRADSEALGGGAYRVRAVVVPLVEAPEALRRNGIIRAYPHSGEAASHPVDVGVKRHRSK